MDTSPEKFYDSLLSYEAPSDDFVSSLAEPHVMEEPEEVPPEDYKVRTLCQAATFPNTTSLIVSSQACLDKHIASNAERQVHVPWSQLAASLKSTLVEHYVMTGATLALPFALPVRCNS